MNLIYLQRKWTNRIFLIQKSKLFINLKYRDFKLINNIIKTNREKMQRIKEIISNTKKRSLIPKFYNDNLNDSNFSEMITFKNNTYIEHYKNKSNYAIEREQRNYFLNYIIKIIWTAKM